MARTAVVNASPLIFLARGGHLPLLRCVADIVLVPHAVAEEINARGDQDVTSCALRQHGWLTIIPGIPIPAIIQAWGLGAGESAVVALALQHLNATAILDDQAGRKCAAACGISVRGTLGVVLYAKKQGRIPAARPVLEDLVRNGMYLSRTTLDAALHLVGE